MWELYGLAVVCPVSWRRTCWGYRAGPTSSYQYHPPPPAMLGEGRMEKYRGNWKSSPREVTLSKDETYSENSRTVKTVTRFERLSLQSISFNPQTTTTEIFNKANFTAGEIKVQKVELTSLRHLKACGRARIWTSVVMFLAHWGFSCQKDWVGPKVHLDFSMRRYVKTWMKFLAILIFMKFPWPENKQNWDTILIVDFTYYHISDNYT